MRRRAKLRERRVSGENLGSAETAFWTLFFPLHYVYFSSLKKLFLTAFKQAGTLNVLSLFSNHVVTWQVLRNYCPGRPAKFLEQTNKLMENDVLGRLILRGRLCSLHFSIGELGN